jgi:hypothetical protein
VKLWQTIAGLAFLAAPGLLWAGDEGVGYINVSEERRFPVSWTKPEFVIQGNGVVSYTPPVPDQWETRFLGFEFTIEFVAVKPFMLANNVEPITPEIRIRNQAGKEVQVAAARHYQRLNGQLFEPLGVLDGRVYFKNVRSGKLCSLPVATADPADASPKPTAAKDEKPGKGQSSKDEKGADEKGAAKSDSSRAK